MAMNEAEAADAEREDAKSYYYPPDEEEPQEIHNMEQKFQEAVEMNRKIFGTPPPAFFRHTSLRRTVKTRSYDLPHSRRHSPII